MKQVKLLALHGFMGEASDFNELADLLSPKVLLQAIDLPGHGNQEMMDKRSFFDRLTKLIQRENFDAYLGYSMGGRLLLEYLASYDVPGKVILIGVNPGLKNENERRKRRQWEDKFFYGYDPKVFFDKWYALPLFGDLKKHPHFETLLQKRITGNMDRWQRALQAFGVAEQPELTHALQNLGDRLLYLAGEQDVKYALLADKFHGHKITAAAHYAHFENPLQVAQNIIQFLVT